jgi:hypothetical protein
MRSADRGRGGALVTIDAYLELGGKRAFAAAIDWPGWSRSGRDEGAALDALASYGPRYRSALGRAGAGLRVPSGPDALRVAERLKGDASTDFGVPAAIPKADRRPMDPKEASAQVALLRASWRAFDRAARAAEGVELTKGPRGGGRDLEKIVGHLLDAEKAYLFKLGGRYRAGEELDPWADMAAVRKAAAGLLRSLARGEPPPRVPRSGSLWPPRAFVRRSAWHALDHAWEIEDRAARVS